LQLLEAGARPDLRGAFEETALHWAAHLGLARLVARLLEVSAGVNLKDARYHSTPVGWALHGCYHSSPAPQGRHHDVVAALVRAGARLEPAWLEDEQVRSDPRMMAALRGQL
jgi:hypothetical protein